MSFKHYVVYVVLALIAGMAMPTQATLNARLATSVHGPVAAAFISFLVGTVALFAYLLVSGYPLANLAAAKQAPPITWIGGLLGACFVTIMALTTPRIGVAFAFSVAIAGQMVLTVLIDHAGWLNTPQHPINAWRLLGIVLITGGVVLIRRF